jgi:eukaryotic-like serine/threonine-protein kinase
MHSRVFLVGGGKRLETTVGTVLAGRYKVESTLGSGGMAVVYRAEDDILGRTVALKTLHQDYAEMPSFRRRFRQEARAMASWSSASPAGTSGTCWPTGVAAA